MFFCYFSFCVKGIFYITHGKSLPPDSSFVIAQFWWGCNIRLRFWLKALLIIANQNVYLLFTFRKRYTKQPA